MVAAGEAFSGTECAALRSMLTRQSSAFFAAYHDSNLEGLQSMLEKELWRRLSLPPDGAALVWWLQVADTTHMLELQDKVLWQWLLLPLDRSTLQPEHGRFCLCTL